MRARHERTTAMPLPGNGEIHESAVVRLRQGLAEAGLDCTCRDKANAVLDSFDAEQTARRRATALADARRMRDAIVIVLALLGEVDEVTPEEPDVSAFDAIEPLFAAARQGMGLEAETYALFGHSAGAQFVHRYMMLTPDTRVARAVAANAGWYSWPDPAIDWPYGLRGAPRPALAQAEIAALPLTLLLGEADRDPDAPNLRRTPQAMAQGESRFRRGIRTAALVDYIAARLGVGSGWNLATVPGVGHDHRGMAPPAVRYLLPDNLHNTAACRRATGED